jgi:hypothetical protein
MRDNHRLPTIQAILLGSCGFIQGFAGTTVTIGNHSGKDLFITRTGGKNPCPILVTSRNDEHPDRPHLLCPPPRPSSPWSEASAAELFGSGPKRRTQSHYLLRSGDAATFSYESQGKDLESELILHRVDGDNGITFEGIVIFTLSHQPGPGPDGIPEPEAKLTLPGGPCPRLRTIPCNRGLTLVSPTELKSLPNPSSKGLAGDEKKVPSQPLG